MKRKILIYSILTITFVTCLIFIGIKRHIPTGFVTGPRTYIYDVTKESNIAVVNSPLPGKDKYDYAGIPTSYWYQVNENGFGYSPYKGLDKQTELFVYNNSLYAEHPKEGLLKMELAPDSTDITQNYIKWNKVSVSINIAHKPVGNYRYANDSKGQLWMIKEGDTISMANFKKVISKSIDLPSSANPWPMAIFKGYIYGVYNYYDGQIQRYVFDIYRAKDIGKGIMDWKKVVPKSFYDFTEIIDVAFMVVFKNKLVVGTNAYRGIFGDPGNYTKGILIYETDTGDPNDWSIISDHGFGTEVYLPVLYKKVRPNQDIGCYAIYKGPNQNQEFLYIGTMAHFGAEIWRYDGAGYKGWKDVTPWWAETTFSVEKPKRYESMIVFNNYLYLAEGYPSANFSVYDGVNWSILVEGPNPFDIDNNRLTSLAELENRIYVNASSIKGDQVWGCPFDKSPLLWKSQYILDNANRSKKTKLEMDVTPFSYE